MTPAREALLVLTACATLYLTGIADIPFYTRGEPREGLVVREMLRTGAWLVPARPEGEPARKPPLYYWIAALTLRALPDRPELALRLPSAVLATAAVLGTWWTARVAFGAGAGLPAALVLASAFEWTRAATSARIDMTLAAAMTAVLVGWILALVRGGGWSALAAAGATLGTLAKGPVAIVLPVLAVAAFVLVTRGERVSGRLRPASTLTTAAVIAGLWYVVALSRQGQPFIEVVARENWHRFVAAEEHAHGIVYLPVLTLVGLLPWTPLLPLALAPLRRTARVPAAVFAAAWIATGMVFFSLAAGKRSVYLLPLYPALALLVGAGVAGPPGGRLARAARLGAALYAPGALLLAAAAGLLILGFDPGTALRPFLGPADVMAAATIAASSRAAAPVLGPLVLATAIAALAAARAARREAWRTLVLVVACAAVGWTAFFDLFVHPSIGQGRSLRSFFAEVAQRVPPDAVLHAVFPVDPGFRFYAPRPLRRWRATDELSGGYLLVWDDERARVRDTTGRPLAALAVSALEHPHRGHLALVEVPAGVRTDSRSR
jgi:4-amino-4-deoxy-L-arabinose transferase-like glycosyltransferase